MSSYNNNNEDKTKRTISTDAPEFRSVSMAAPALPPPRMFMGSAPIASKTHLTSSAPSKAKLSSPAPVAEKWVWELDTIQPVPLFHPLERTAFTIKDMSSETVTTRISEFMRHRSISCQYHDADGRVDCLTECLTKFCVQLWRNQDGIVMEVQRLGGCCIALQAIRSDLNQAIMNPDTLTDKPKPSRKQFDIMERTVDGLAFGGKKSVMNDNEATPLEVCRRMLESDLLDENRLGLESLAMLTDPSKVLASVADQACEAVLDSKSSLHSLVAKHFEQTRAQENKNADEIMDYEQGAFFGCCHLLALKVVCHSLDSVAHLKGSKVSIDLSSPFWQTVLPAIYYNVKVADTRPLEASLSIRCLRNLQTVEPSMALAVENAAASEPLLQECLQNANRFGKHHNQSLEKETEKLMGRMGFVN